MKIYLLGSEDAELLYEGEGKFVKDDLGYYCIVLQDESSIRVHPYKECHIWDSENDNSTDVDIPYPYNFQIRVDREGVSSIQSANGPVPQEVIDLLKRKGKALKAA